MEAVPADVPGGRRGEPAKRRKTESWIYVRAVRGLLLTECEPEHHGQRWTFPERNRIIAALASLTIVVEAPEASGALIYYQLDKDWHYRSEERRWVALNEKSQWRKAELVKGKVNISQLHVR